MKVTHVQQTFSPEPPIKIHRHKLSPAQKQSRQEKKEAHTTFKLFKATGFSTVLLSDNQILLLKKYYGI